MTPRLSTTGRLLVTSMGLGYLRPASGTWGSLPPVALAAALIAAGLGPGDGWLGWSIYNAALAATAIKFTAACLIFGRAAEAHFGRKDPSQVVADETAGMSLPLLFLPARSVGDIETAALTLGGAFVVFRLLDILKPPPAWRLQRLPGGAGIVADDLVAGAMAAAIIQIVCLAFL